MAVKLPEYKRQVELAPLRGQQAQVVNASTAPGLDALGRGIQQFGAGLGQHEARREAEEARERAKGDALRADTVKAQIVGMKNNLLESAQGGILNTRGQNAIIESSGAQNFFEKQIEQATHGLTSSQRAMLEPVIVEEINSLNRIIDHHVSKQTAQLAEDTSNAILKGKAGEAVSAIMRGDMGAFDDAHGAGLGQIDQLSEESGDTPQIKAAREAEYTDGTMRAAIEATITTNPERAVALFESWKSKLNPMQVTATKLRERIEATSLKLTAEAVAGNAIDKFGVDFAAGEASINADASLPPAVRALAVDSVKKRFDEFDEAQTRADVNTLALVSKTISIGRGRVTIEQILHDPDYLRFNKEAYKAKALDMVGAEKRARSSDADERRAQAERDAEAIANFNRLAAENPEEAVALDTDSHYANATQKARDAIGAAKGKKREQIEKGEAVSETEFSRQLKSNIAPGIDSKEVERRVDEGLAWYAKRKRELGGKDVPDKEIEDFIAKKLAKVQTKGIFSPNEMTRWQAESRGKTIIEPKEEPKPEAPKPASAAPAPGATKVGAKRTVKGETRTWDGQAWVK